MTSTDGYEIRPRHDEKAQVSYKIRRRYEDAPARVHQVPSQVALTAFYLRHAAVVVSGGRILLLPSAPSCVCLFGIWVCACLLADWRHGIPRLDVYLESKLTYCTASHQTPSMKKRLKIGYTGMRDNFRALPTSLSRRAFSSTTHQQKSGMLSSSISCRTYARIIRRYDITIELKLRLHTKSPKHS